MRCLIHPSAFLLHPLLSLLRSDIHTKGRLPVERCHINVLGSDTAENEALADVVSFANGQDLPVAGECSNRCRRGTERSEKAISEDERRCGYGRRFQNCYRNRGGIGRPMHCYRDPCPGRRLELLECEKISPRGEGARVVSRRVAKPLQRSGRVAHVWRGVNSRSVLAALLRLQSRRNEYPGHTSADQRGHYGSSEPLTQASSSHWTHSS